MQGEGGGGIGKGVCRGIGKKGEGIRLGETDIPIANWDIGHVSSQENNKLVNMCVKT